MKDINHQYHGVPWKNSLLLLLTAVIWGIAFVAQSVGMDYVGPFTFNGVRSLIGAAVLLVLAAVITFVSIGSRDKGIKIGFYGIDSATEDIFVELVKNSFESPDIYAGNPGAFHKSRALID